MGIINNDLPLNKLVEATGTKDKESLIKTLANLHPHPVYIDVSTSRVGAGNFVASSEFKDIIANLHPPPPPPPPVYIDVSTSLVGAGNFVASSEFKKIIK